MKLKNAIRFVATALMLAVMFAAAPAPATAQAQPTVDGAKAAGLVGEQWNGYLGLVGDGASAEVRKLIEEINLKRRQKYREIARTNGTSLEAVEAIAGKKLVERAASGTYVRTGPNQGWVAKP